MVTGVVREILPGIGFRVNSVMGSQTSILWRDLTLMIGQLLPSLTEPPSDNPVLRRSDSGIDYGAPGFPDCEFWERNGVEPLFVATPAHYSNRKTEAAAIVDMLNGYKERAWELGGAYMRAWKRQMLAAIADMTTSINMLSHTSLDLDVHRGQGILAGDFIKPDPVLTQRETRVYLLAELTRWLTSESLSAHAREIDTNGLAVEALESYLAAGTWPAARLYTVQRLLARDNNVREGFDAKSLGTWVTGVCSAYLKGEPLETPCRAATIALGFVTTDKLPGGAVIESFWNYSPFGPLREAPTLDVVAAAAAAAATVAESVLLDEGDGEGEEGEEGEEGDEGEEEGEEGEEGDEEGEEGEESEGDDEDEEPEVDVSAPFGSYNAPLNAFLSDNYTITVPGWALVVAVTATSIFLALLAGDKRC